MAAKRILKEIRDLDSSPHDEFAAGPNSQDDLFRWTATLNGPKGTPYEGGAFYIDIKFPPEYPFKPPRMQFITKIYHPNVDYQGSMSIDILCEKWSPALTISKVLLSISIMVTSPNPDDPLLPEIADLYKKNRKKFNETAAEWTRRYAI